MPVPDFLQPWLGKNELVAPLLYSGLALLVLFLLLVLWLIFGKGPRRRRAFNRARFWLQRGDWQQALDIALDLQGQGRLSAMWQGRLRNLEGECHHTAGEQALQDKRFEDGRKHFFLSAQCLNVDGIELRQRVLDAMLAETRALFAAAQSSTDTEAVQKLIARILEMQSPCAEASFWHGLCLVRSGLFEPALAALALAQQEGKTFLDPPLYQGALLLRAGRPQEALRLLGEANRIDTNCPFVTWQLGMAIVAAGGDCSMAVRALQKAIGPRGLALWNDKPARAWIEAFPGGKSYIRQLAQEHSFVCPVFGSDLNAMIREGRQVLAQAHYKLGNFQESADLYTKLLQDSPPTVPLLRGLGMALTRLEMYDQAYKHLRTAHEQEEPKNPFTAGYLALCGAMGKPSQPEAKQKNVAWAIGLLARYQGPGNREWAQLCSKVFAEARQIGLPVAVEDQLRLCEVLVSVKATDPEAAAAYAHLTGCFPDALQPEFAWLYCKAAQEHRFSTEHDLKLFGLMFQEAPAARAYYEQQGWNFDEVEFTFLERRAVLSPGSFPPELGPDYPAHGENLLLSRSRLQEMAGQQEAALASTEILLKLSPKNGPAHDRLAQLYYRKGDLDRATELLAHWYQLEPGNPLPLVRRAILEQQRGNSTLREQIVSRALELSEGKQRAEIAFLGSKLALADGSSANLPSASTLLQECLKDHPDHTDALWCLAAVRSILGDREGLAVQASVMDRPSIADPRFHYLAAVCHFAAGDYPRVIEGCQRSLALVGNDNGVPESPAAQLAAESEYLMGWSYLHLQDQTAAITALTRTTLAPASFSKEHARGLMGRICFSRAEYERAIRWWTALDAGKRAEWMLEEPLRSTVFMSGLLSYQAGDFEQAAEKFREAGRLGLRDRRLGPLLSLAYYKAGQRLLFKGKEGHHAPSTV